MPMIAAANRPSAPGSGTCVPPLEPPLVPPVVVLPLVVVVVPPVVVLPLVVLPLVVDEVLVEVLQLTLQPPQFHYVACAGAAIEKALRPSAIAKILVFITNPL